VSELWSEGLTRFGGPFLGGKAFSNVDAFFAPVAFRVQTYGLTLDAPAQAYTQRLLELPAMKEWYAAALAERLRDEHDEFTARFGTVTQDLRAKVG
jgi:glutathione S-transferase